MPTSLHSVEEDKPHRPLLPPVGDVQALAQESPAADTAGLDTAVAVGAAIPQDLSPVKVPDRSLGAEVGRWAYAHPQFTKAPLSYLGYQFARASAAAIPYGAMMALGHHVFGTMSAVGQKMGLTAEGTKAFAEAVSQKKGGLGAADVEKFYKEFDQVAGKMGKRELTPMIGRNMMRLGNSPMNPAVQIALGFTLFRFTGGIVKNLRDRIFNEKNTEADTIHETKHWWQTVKETAHTNWKAESGSTPIAALVLGFMNAAYIPSPEGTPVRNKALYPETKGFLTQVKEVWSPKSKLLQNAGVWTLSYSLFFLLAECLFKDIQVRRGLWKGHPNSLKNGPDDITGGPGAVHYHSPEEGPLMIAQSAEQGYQKVAVHPEDKGHEDGKAKDKADDSNHPLRYPLLTGEPSYGRFWLRRVLPVCVGISAYAALKRVGYLAAGGPMQQITVPKLAELKTVGAHAKFYLENYRREALATTMFGALWAATDLGSQWYDKFFEKLQKPENHVPLTPHQQRNHADLLARLNEKQAAPVPVANDNGVNDNSKTSQVNPQQAVKFQELVGRVEEKENIASRA